MVAVPDPGAAIVELGLKVMYTLRPPPEAEGLMAESKPPEIAVVIVELPVVPLRTLTDVGDALMPKSGCPPVVVTVNEKLVVCVVLPELPVTSIRYVPVAVDAATISVIVEVPAPAIELGLKLMVTPEGWPVADREMVELNAPVTVLVIVAVPELPCATVAEAGDAERLKSEADEPPARALIKPLLFGLPQPVAKSYPLVAE